MVIGVLVGALLFSCGPGANAVRGGVGVPYMGRPASVAIGPGHLEKALVPPPEPRVPPGIVRPAERDRNADGIDDQLEARLQAAKAALAAEKDPAKRAAAQAALNERVRVELLFSKQITQKQIDDFVALGGQIEYIYQAVSYGWNANLPLGAVEGLPRLMGGSFVAVLGDRPVKAHLDEATRCGRVRPVWVPGFAGSLFGFLGNVNDVIAVIDSGVDDSHADLSGFKEYWKDWTSTNAANPEDPCGHGSHVTGIAVGKGYMAGSDAGTLYYTDSGDMTTLPSNWFWMSPIHIYASNTTFSSTAGWPVLVNTSLHQDWRNDGNTLGYTWLANSATGASPLSTSNTFSPSWTRQYTTELVQNATRSINYYAIYNTVTNYPAVGDGYPKFQGVLRGHNWAGVRVLGADGKGTLLDLQEGVDDVVTQRITHKIKVANMSIGVQDTNGYPTTDPTLRAKVNTAVDNGIVMVISAGNDGPGTGSTHEVADPGRAGLAITVAASNDINELTDYTSSGFPSPGSDEDYKPDLMAPGGSKYYSYILSVDSNDGEAYGHISEYVVNDYANMMGTSMASPMVAGSCLLMIQALGLSNNWDWYSSDYPLLIKAILCATATESNAAREVGSGAGSGTDPTLGRAVAPKDLYEGYGLMNLDAAIEAACQRYYAGQLSDSTAGGRFDRRAWGRKLSIGAGYRVTLSLDVPATGDFDLYIYSGTPGSKGNPTILASSTSAGNGADESIDYTPSTTETAYLVIKRISGNGTWTLTGTTDPNAPVAGTATSSQYAGTTPIVVNYSGASDVGPSGLKKVELWYKKGAGGTWTNSGLTQTVGSGSFNFSGVSGDDVYYFDLVAEDNASNRSADAAGDGDCSTTYDTAPPSYSGTPSAGTAYTTNTSVTFTWTASTDNLSGVARYHCHIGSTPEQSDVFDEDVGTTPSNTITGEYGRAYFCSVCAFDNAGNQSGWSSDYYGISVVENGPVTVGAAKKLSFGERAPSVGLDAKIITAVFWHFDGDYYVLDYIYVEDQDRSAGIRVYPLVWGDWVLPGSIVDVGGVINMTADYEKYITNATTVYLDSDEPKSVGMANRSLGGSDWFWDESTGAGQKGVSGGVGLNNIGLLVRTAGWVIFVDRENQIYYIDDGSARSEADIVAVDDWNRPNIDPGQFVTLTGISSCQFWSEGPWFSRLLRIPPPWEGPLDAGLVRGR